MNTKVKSNSVITTEIDTAAKTVTLNVLGAGAVTLALSDMSQENRDYAALHGMKQRLADGAAIARDTDTGLAATPSEKLAAIKHIRDHYASGSIHWNLKRAEGGGRDTTGQTESAMVALYGADKSEQFIAGVMAKRGIERKAALAVWAATPEVTAKIAELKAARATVSAEDLMAEMTGGA